MFSWSLSLWGWNSYAWSTLCFVVTQEGQAPSASKLTGEFWPVYILIGYINGVISLIMVFKHNIFSPTFSSFSGQSHLWRFGSFCSSLARKSFFTFWLCDFYWWWVMTKGTWRLLSSRECISTPEVLERLCVYTYKVWTPTSI